MKNCWNWNALSSIGTLLIGVGTVGIALGLPKMLEKYNEASEKALHASTVALQVSKEIDSTSRIFLKYMKDPEMRSQPYGPPKR